MCGGLCIFSPASLPLLTLVRYCRGICVGQFVWRNMYLQPCSFSSSFNGKIEKERNMEGLP